LIGTALSIPSGTWGNTGKQLSFVAGNNAASGVRIFAGVALDVSDLNLGPNALNLAGIRVTSGGTDPLSIGFTSVAIPEPSLVAVLGIFGLGIIGRRRRG